MICSRRLSAFGTNFSTSLNHCLHKSVSGYSERPNLVA